MGNYVFLKLKFRLERTLNFQTDVKIDEHKGTCPITICLLFV